MENYIQTTFDTNQIFNETQNAINNFTEQIQELVATFAEINTMTLAGAEHTTEIATKSQDILSGTETLNKNKENLVEAVDKLNSIIGKFKV